MGISRSATVVCAYLIATTAMQPHEAVEFLQAKREIVCPNAGFRRQLDVYAARLRGSRKLRKAAHPPPSHPHAHASAHPRPQLHSPRSPPMRRNKTHDFDFDDGSLAADGIRLLRTGSPRLAHPPPPVAVTRRGSMG